MTDARQSTDFTEDAYRALVKLARSRYEFRSFAEALEMTSGVLWRHDIDMSVHRALALAKIEHEENVRATYFIHLHSTFYNALEAGIVSRLRDIAALGHHIGVHFDPQFHGVTPSDGDALERAVSAERDLVAATIGAPIAAVSFHDPDVAGFTTMAGDRVAGLVNAYGPAIRDGFTYCSDSNGYWRFTPLDELLDAGHKKLHVLTHPEWWVPEPMTPRARVARAIEGRAAATASRYDEALEKLGRDNRRE